MEIEMVATMPDGTSVPTVVLDGAWRRDTAAFDPSRMVRRVTVHGRGVELSNCLGPGFPMTARIDDAPPLTSATLGWEDWAALAAYVASVSVGG